MCCSSSKNKRCLFGLDQTADGNEKQRSTSPIHSELLGLSSLSSHHFCDPLHLGLFLDSSHCFVERVENEDNRMEEGGVNLVFKKSGN